MLALGERKSIFRNACRTGSSFQTSKIHDGKNLRTFGIAVSSSMQKGGESVLKVVAKTLSGFEKLVKNI